MSMKDVAHGAIGTREQPFTELLPPGKVYAAHSLVGLAASIKADIDAVKDGADAEENVLLPSGYTYLGQFIDHDLTFDNTSSLNPQDTPDSNRRDRMPSNLRTPRFDLDSVYGDGPDAQPYMYADDGASLIFKDSFTNQCQSNFDQAQQDLLRAPNGRAIIGDKRNDENSIISQIQLTFIKFHNAVVAKVKIKEPDLKGTALFEKAREQVRWAYQKLVIEDFLPRIVQPQVLKDLTDKTPQERKSRYLLYTEDKRSNLPREFVGAAYRFGHSGVRFGYRLNTETSLSIFAPSVPPDPSVPAQDEDGLLGFDPLPKSQVIDDWGRFFPSTLPNVIPANGLGDPPPEDDKGNAIPNPEVRLQFAYKIDTTLADPMTVLPPSVLPTSPDPGGAIGEVEAAIRPDRIPDPQGRPSLALLNLLRGNTYKLQGGQAIASALKVAPLDPKYLVTRQSIKNNQGEPSGKSKFVPIGLDLTKDTPLWFYILAEAQQSVIDALEQRHLIVNGEFDDERLREKEIAQTQLGWVGGRIVAEVFYGLMDSDTDSYLNQPASNNGKAFQPIWANDPTINDATIIFANLLKFAGQPITKTPKPPVSGC
ncbi:peroxidase family protein [Chamaesiphon sp. VAR_69_metabat_338]|uniref:peroxidase family protein n=1 Tax=Chamaesiphon sp. VAR_69_metabat_338 TaxID=2964704 RepID=UPI00286DA792|nr:peroxidase family protein [Chamaesiphon sp. VAR_69_metabat_338]